MVEFDKADPAMEADDQDVRMRIEIQGRPSPLGSPRQRDFGGCVTEGQSHECCSENTHLASLKFSNTGCLFRNTKHCCKPKEPPRWSADYYRLDCDVVRSR